jgi:hypothetical protein
MNGEDNNLTLGEVQSPQQEIQQTPDISINEYLGRLRSMGVDDADAVSVMSRNGYNSQDVYNEMVSQYEAQREEFLKRQEEDRQRRLQAEARADEMSAKLDVEKKKEEPTDSLGTPLESIDDFKGLAEGVFEELGVGSYKDQKINPLTATATPSDIAEALKNNEDAGLRVQSYENDQALFNVRREQELLSDVNKAIRDRDLDSYNKIARQIEEMGNYMPQLESEDDFDQAQSNSRAMFFDIEDKKKSLINERNLINDEYGLPSDFNPDSNVDFMYAMRESLERQQIDFESSEQYEYMQEVMKEAEEVAEFRKNLYDKPLGAPATFVRNYLGGFAKEILEMAVFAAPQYYYEFTGQDEKANAIAANNKRVQDVNSMASQMYQQKRGVSKELSEAGLTESIGMAMRGDVSGDDFRTKLGIETGQIFASAASYMHPIGLAMRARGAAKVAQAAVPRGAGVLTSSQAATARAADAAYKSANAGYRAVLGTLGLTSAADTYQSLYERPDLSLGEKTVQAALVGTAEATLNAIFGNVERLFVSGATATARAEATRSFAKMAKEQLAKVSRARGAREAFKTTGKGLSEEFLEEFGVEVVAQGAEILNDIAMGRKPKDVDWYSLIDAGLAGLIGAGPTSALAGVGTFQAHNSLIRRRKQLADQISEIDDAIFNADSAEEKKRLNQIKEGVSAELMVIDDASRVAFENLSEGQRRRLLKIHRDMAYTENAMRRKDLTKEEREQLTTRYESLLRAKTDIENSGEKPNLSRDDDSVPAQDAAGQEVEIKGEDTTREDDVKVETAETATEEAPEEQRQEAVQLSLFDETQEEEAPVEAEAPVAEEAPAAEEAPKTEKAEPSEGVKTFTDMGGDLVDVTDADVVGEGEGKLSLDAAIAINRMSKAFGGALQGAGYKFQLYSRDAFDAMVSKSEPNADPKDFGGFVDHDTKTIVIPSDAKAAEVFEEFGHAALKDIIGKDAKARESIYKTLEGIAKRNPDVRQILDQTRADEVYSRQGEAAIQEEAIIASLIAYAQNPEALGKGGFVSKMMAAINKVFARIVGKDVKVIENEQRFLEFARKFAAATRGEQVEITDPGIQDQDLTKRPDESEQEYRDRLARAAEQMDPMTDEQRAQQEFEDRGEDISMMRFARRNKTEFTYLKDTTVYYREDPYADIGSTMQNEHGLRDKKINVKDYFHFRNWFNYMTANGRRPARIMKMYFIKDGKKYTIKPPKPKTDREGNVVRMEGPLHGRLAAADRAQKERQRRGTLVRDARDRVFQLEEAAAVLKSAGIDPALGMALVPGFNLGEYAETPQDEKSSYASKFRREVLFNRSLEEQEEVLEIANENLQLLKDSGLSASEIEAADKAALLNMSGRTPSFLAQGGDTLNSGNIRFARRAPGRRERVMTKEQSEAWKESIRNEFPGISDEDLFWVEQELKDIDGAQSILIGYDRSGAQTNTGIINQAKQILSGRVVSSHRNKRMRERVFKKMVALANKDRRSKNPKGYIVVAIGALDIPSLPGNPQVFSKIVLDHVMEVEGAERIKRINDILKSLSKDDLKGLYRASLERGNVGHISKRFMLGGLDSSKLKDGIKNDIEAQDFVEIIKDVRGFDDFATSFNSRAKIGRRIIKDFVLGVRGGGSSADIDNHIQQNFSDLSLKDVPGASVVSMMKIPYEAEGFLDIDDSDSDAFPDAIVSTTAGRMKFLANPVPVERAYAKATYVEEGRARKVFTKKAEKEGRVIKYAKKRLGYGAEAPLTFDDDVITDHRYARRTGQQAFTMKEETAFQKWKNLWVRRLQDKYVDIFNIQESIERQKGRVERAQDFKMAEELMYGKAAEDLAKLDKRVEEIISLMKKSGIKVDEVSKYLYALHAKERNAVISERSEGAIKDGSGISDAEAEAILNAANKKALDPIVSKIREIQQDTRNTMLKYGLETKETVDAFEAMFQNYVPLAGLSVDEELSSPYPTGGAGMNVFGSTTKRATGRKTEAENILAQVVAQNASIHIKARTNEALNALYNLVKENPNTKIWRLVDGKSGIDPNDPRVVAVRVNGEQKYIMFKDASYAQNLRGMNLPQTNAFIRALRIPAQWLRRSFTTLNPEFVISNFSRDIQAAIFNAAAEADIEGGMLNSKATIGRMMGLVPQTLKTLVKNSVQKGGDPAIEKYFSEFKEDGGKTGWAYAKSLDQIANELEGAAEDKTRTQEILGKAKNFAETIEGVNDAFENSIRLAAYIAARENGVTREKAAQMAKNITVNFNKQGEWGPALNAVYLFFNASIQGTARLGRSLATLKPSKRPDGTDRTAVERVNTAQWMAGGLMIFNAMLTTLGYAMSDEDEDGVPFWDKIPDYVKERNLIIMRPNGKDYFKIPMPYGFNVFANMGTALVEGSRGAKEPTEAMMFLFNSFMASFSPVSFGQSKDLFVAAGKGAVPTVMKPFVDIMVNETYFGGPVTGENLPFGIQRPESELSFRSPESVKDFFKWMNEATGGSQYKSGEVDINPDKFWYMFEYFIGGAGQFVNRSMALPRDMAIKLFGNSDIEVEANQIPLARILYGEPSKYYDYEKFKDNEQEFKSLYKELKEAPRRGDAARYKGVSEGANKTLNEVRKMLKQLRSAEQAARRIPDYTERMIRVQEIRDKQRKLVMRWNKYYEQARD